MFSADSNPVLHSLTGCAWGSHYFWLKSHWKSLFAPVLIYAANLSHRCVCVVLNDYHLFDAVFSWIYLLMRFACGSFEANVWAGQKQTMNDETVTLDCTDLVWWDHFSWTSPPTANWLPLFQLNLLFSIAHLSCRLPQSWKPSRFIPFARSQRLFWLPGVFLLHLPLIKRTGHWALHLILKAELSCQDSNKFLITKLPWLCQSESLKNFPCFIQVT